VVLGLDFPLYGRWGRPLWILGYTPVKATSLGYLSHVQLSGKEDSEVGNTFCASEFLVCRKYASSQVSVLNGILILTFIQVHYDLSRDSSFPPTLLSSSAFILHFSGRQYQIRPSHVRNITYNWFVLHFLELAPVIPPPIWPESIVYVLGTYDTFQKQHYAFQKHKLYFYISKILILWNIYWYLSRMYSVFELNTAGRWNGQTGDLHGNTAHRKCDWIHTSKLLPERLFPKF